MLIAVLALHMLYQHRVRAQDNNDDTSTDDADTADDDTSSTSADDESSTGGIRYDEDGNEIIEYEAYFDHRTRLFLS